MSTLPTVYFSYAWGDGETPEGQLREEVANTLYQEIKKRERTGDLKVVIDREQMKYRDSIRKFTTQYADASLVVMIISEKYLKSEFCMGEVVEVLSNRDYRQRILPVLLPDAGLNEPKKCIAYHKHWVEIKKDFDAEMASIEDTTHTGPFIQQQKEYAEIIRIVANFTTEIGDTITVRPPVYQPMLNALDQQIYALKTKKIPKPTSISALHSCDRRKIFQKFDLHCFNLTKAGKHSSSAIYWLIKSTARWKV
jgi:hypothetical protein